MLKIGLMYPKLASTLLCGQRWLWAYDSSPASSPSQVLGAQVHATVPRLGTLVI